MCLHAINKRLFTDILSTLPDKPLKVLRLLKPQALNILGKKDMLIFYDSELNHYTKNWNLNLIVRLPNIPTPTILHHMKMTIKHTSSILICFWLLCTQPRIPTAVCTRAVRQYHRNITLPLAKGQVHLAKLHVWWDDPAELFCTSVRTRVSIFAAAMICTESTFCPVWQ